MMRFLLQYEIRKRMKKCYNTEIQVKYLTEVQRKKYKCFNKVSYRHLNATIEYYFSHKCTKTCLFTQ